MVLISLHVPRAGGTSLTGILREQYGDIQVVTDKSEKALNKGKYEAQVIHGHIPYGIHRKLKVPCQYITVLRHPVDRIVSLYYYIQGLAGKGWWATKGVRHDTTLEEFIELPMWHLENSQTRQMCGKPFRHQGIYPRSQGVSYDHFKEAWQNLQSFAAVGRLEEFDQTLQHFSEVLNWQKEITPVHLNEVDDYPPPSKAIRERILERNEWDIKLWLDLPQIQK